MLGVDSSQRFREERRDGELAYLVDLLVLLERNRVGEDDFLDDGVTQPVDGGAGEYAVRRAGVDFLRASLLD